MGNSEVRDQSVRSARLNEAFERLSSTLPLARSPISVPKPDFHSVLLTGSTGYIGSYILASLLQDETVNHIYCLHRGLNGAARQKTSFTEKGIPITSSFDLKVEFCSVNLYEKKLGLNDTAYDKLTDTVDMVIHNAWSVNYAFSLKSFEESDLLGLRNIVDLCLQSKHRPRLHFISSITTVAHWPQYYDAPLTERIVHDARLPIPIGYAESKYVAELFLEKAVEQSGLQCSIIRPSQIAGPTTIRGIWNPNDVVPILVSTSINLGVFPYHATDRLLIDWVPMDICGKVIVEILMGENGMPTDKIGVFHVLNSQPISWSLLVSTTQDLYPVGVMPLETWILKVKHLISGSKGGAKHELSRIAPLLPFLSWVEANGAGFSQFETARAKRYSQTMKALGPVNGNLVQRWLQQWSFYPELMVYD